MFLFKLQVMNCGIFSLLLSYDNGGNFTFRHKTLVGFLIKTCMSQVLGKRKERDSCELDADNLLNRVGSRISDELMVQWEIVVKHLSYLRFLL
jgi:hypothetical protein